MNPSVHCSTVYSNQDTEATECPSREEWIQKMWYIQAMEYYSAMKKTEMMQQHEWS